MPPRPEARGARTYGQRSVDRGPLKKISHHRSRAQIRRGSTPAGAEYGSV